MANPSKKKGTAAESAVVAWSVMAGVPAKRAPLAGAADHGDVWLWPTESGGARVVVEVKDVPSQFTHIPWGVHLQGLWGEAEREAARVTDADVAVLVVKPKGISHERVGEWFAWTLPSDLHFWASGEAWYDGPHVPVMLPYGSLLSWLFRTRRGGQ